MAPGFSSRIRKVLGNPHFWLIIVIFIILSLLHYLFPISGVLPTQSLGLTRHTVDRILLLVPVVYAAVVFGIYGGAISLFVALAIMLPRAIMDNGNRFDVILEIIGIMIVGIFFNVWIELLQREKRRRQHTIEALEQTQDVLRLNERRLAALNSISHTMSQLSNLQEALKNTLEQIVRVMDLEIALIFALDRTGEELELTAYSGVSEEFAEGLKRMRVGEGLNGQVAKSGEPLLVEDTAHDPRLTREVVARERLAAQVIVPVKSKEKTIGTLAVGVRRQRRFTSDEIGMLRAIGDEIGVAIENAKLYEEQLSLAEQLRQSERNYRELFEKAHDAIWVHDLDGNILTANEAASRMVGYTIPELLKMNVRSFLDEESLMVAKDVRQRLLAGEKIIRPYEQRLAKQGGGEASLMLTTSLIIMDGKNKVFQHIARDVTEQKKMTENLRFYVQQITSAQEEERKRVARELHDDTAQSLVVLSRQIDKLMSAQPPLTKDLTPIENLASQVDSILDGVRRFSQDLRPSVLDDLGLIPALEWLASDLSEHFGIVVSVEVTGTERRFPPEMELLLFRISQEALRNVWRHSGATKAWVAIRFEEGKTVLTVIDSGKGFKVPQPLGDLTVVSKLGLAGMAERANLLGGNLKIVSEIGRGTTVSVEVPI